MPCMWDTPPCCEDTETEEAREPLQKLRFPEEQLQSDIQLKGQTFLMHSYWLLLAEEKTAKLWIGSWVREAEDGTLRRCLSTLCDLVGWSAANWRLLVGWYGCSHCHLKEPRLKIPLDLLLMIFTDMVTSTSLINSSMWLHPVRAFF